MASSTFLQAIPAFWHVLGDPLPGGRDGPAVVEVEVVHGLVHRCNCSTSTCHLFPCSWLTISHCIARHCSKVIPVSARRADPFGKPQRVMWVSVRHPECPPVRHLAFQFPAVQHQERPSIWHPEGLFIQHPIVWHLAVRQLAVPQLDCQSIRHPAVQHWMCN